MTVENKISKTDKLVMGSKTYDFGFDVLLEDPTEEDAKQAIRCAVSDGTSEHDLEYGTDYSVSLNEDGKGGTVTVSDAKDDTWTIIVYREYHETQGSDYKDYSSFPAETLEKDLDKVTMILQQHQEQLDRTVKVAITDNQTPQELLDEVYGKLDSATEIAAEAIKAADEATTAANNATEAVESAEQTLAEVTAYVDAAKVDINDTKTAAITAIEETKAAAEKSINDTKDAAESSINATKAAAESEINATKTAATTEIEATKTEAINTIDTTVAEADETIKGYVAAAETEVRQIARDEAEKAIANAADEATATAKANVNAYVDGTIKPDLQTYVTAAAGSASAAATSAGKAEQSASDAATTLTEVEQTASSFNTVFNNRVTEFNANATAKTNEFNANAAAKTTAFDEHAAAKTSDFDSNAAAKQAAVDASAASAAASQQAAATSETNAKTSEDNAAQSALLAQTLAERVKSEGIPMSIIEQRRIEKTADTVKLWWKDPRDTIIDGFVLASWKSTTIVKKQGSYPEDIDDGTVVEIITQRNKYFDTPLTDTQANAADWYYRAFPLTVNGVYGLDKRNCFGAVLFGYRINKNEPVPSAKVEYLQYCDNYFYDPCRMDFATDKFGWGSWEKAFFIPQPCALTYAGAVSYYLDKNDFTKKADGTASDVSNSAFGGNFRVEFPDIFVKFWDEDNYFYCLFSNIKLDDGFECWATKKADGTYTGRFYMPMFEGTNIDSKLRSVATTGKPTGNTTAETEATLAHANGTNWETTTWAQEMLMILLYPLLFKSTDSQGTLGYGGSGSTSGLTVNNNAAVTRGLMYGTSGAAAAGMTYLGMHNYWGHRWRRPNGLMNMNGDYAFKMTPSTVDGSTVTGFNRTGNGYVKSGVVPPAASSSYIDRYQAIGKLGFVPQTTTGSSTTHYCDGMWTNNGQLDQLILGGAVYFGALCGVFCFYVYDLPAHSNWAIGASVSYTPF